jgi:hypothetical protein
MSAVLERTQNIDLDSVGLGVLNKDVAGMAKCLFSRSINRRLEQALSQGLAQNMVCLFARHGC